MQKTPTPYREKRSPIDLVRQFEEDHIDLKPLLDSRKVTLEVEGSLTKYNGVFGVKQKKHLLNRCLVGYAERHLKDLDNLTLDQAIELLFTMHDLGEPVNNYYEDLSPHLN